jgi:alpha-beta hydrolase superfamily lysophospholipase
MMEAFPLDDVAAVKVYLGLPLFGRRAPPGGVDEMIARQKEDVGLRVFEPVVVGASQELPRVVRELERQDCMRHGERISLFGFSAGGAAALVSLAQRDVEIEAVVLLNPSTGLTSSVQAYEHATSQHYVWTGRSRSLATRTDAAGRAADIARGAPLPALLLVEGADDDVIGDSGVNLLAKALTPLYANARAGERLQFVVLHGLPHNITGSQMETELGRTVSDWLNRYAEK